MPVNTTLQQVQSLGVWYQHFHLPDGTWTGEGAKIGYDAELRWMYIAPYLPDNLHGKTVLDMGGNAGFFSVQMKQRGASRCVLVDPYTEYIEQARFVARQYAVELEYVTEDAHVYCLTTEERFDYVLCLGLLYHLKYPGLVMDRLAEMTKERMFLLSAIVGDEKDYEEQSNCQREIDDHGLLEQGFPKWAFIENRYNDDSTNWWIPNYAAFSSMVRSAGLRIIDRPDRTIIIAEPEYYLGKVIYPKLVFPRYGKKGEAILPGAQEPDRRTWTPIPPNPDLQEKHWKYIIIHSFLTLLISAKRKMWRLYLKSRAKALR